MLYGLFMISLAVGLAGACLFLHRLYETLLLNWDPVAEVVEAIRRRRDERFLRRQSSAKVLDEIQPVVLQTRMDSNKYHRIEMEAARAAASAKQ